jgi:hypothetical protein
MTGLRHLRGPGALEQHGVREAFHLGVRDAGLLGDLFDGGAGTDAGLDFAGAELTVHFDLNLAESSDVPAGGRAEFVIGWEPELFAGVWIRTHHVRAARFETYYSQLPHVRPPHRADSRSRHDRL